MSGFKGTSGKWEFHDDDESCRQIVVSDGGDVICVVGPWNTSIEEDYANGALIAAAPELLEALQASMGIWENHKLDVSEASILLDCRAAIAKALGQ